MNRLLFCRCALLAVAALAVSGCGKGDSGSLPAGPLLFRDVTEEVGLSFIHDAGPVGTHALPQIIGSGAALFDYDNDGQLDIYLIHNAGPASKSTNRLFHQEKDGRFRDVSAGSGLDIAGYGMGAAVGDINNDGWPDLLVTQYGGSRLFLNNGNGTFTEVTHESGLDLVLWGASACFFDYDRDGWLDLVLVHYVDYGAGRPCLDIVGRSEYCPPQVFPGTVTKLFLNRGRSPSDKKTSVHFEDVTVPSGLAKRPGPGLGVVCADFDGDGWPDILIANDRQANCLWINRRDGTFQEEGLSRGIAYNAEGQAQANMGVALGDVDGDGRFDVFITHLTEETHTLWRQTGPGLFQDRTVAAGLAASHWRGTGFGTVMADFNQDGAPDLAVVNGRIQHSPPSPTTTAEDRARLGPFWIEYAERNQLFLNDGRGGFEDVSLANAPFSGVLGVFRGLAYGDIDGDGAVDLLVTSIDGPARLYLNVAPNRGHWLLVRVFDPALRRDAYGAEVTAIAGKQRWKCWANPGSSYLCSNDPRFHFGLGETAQVDAFEVLWPDGTHERFDGCAADQAVELRKGTRQPVLRKRRTP